MEQYFEDLTKKYPQVLKKEIIGQSYEGKSIYMFKITSEPSLTLKCSYDSPSSSSNNNHLSSNSLTDIRRHYQKTRARSNFYVNSEPKSDFIDASPTGFEQQTYGYRIRPKRQISRLKRNERISNATHNFYYLDFAHFFTSSPAVSRRRQQAGPASTKPFKTVPKPVVLIDGGSHAREWISPASLLCLMEHLATNPQMTDKIEWQIIPIINPDGYVYSYTKVRPQNTLDPCQNRTKSRKSESFKVKNESNIDIPSFEIG